MEWLCVGVLDVSWWVFDKIGSGVCGVVNDVVFVFLLVGCVFWVVVVL